MEQLRIVLPGGSGQVGTVVARHFHAQGHSVVVLTRNPAPAPWKTIRWDAESVGPWSAEFENADLVLNLAGRSVNCRYTETNRRAIMDSRTKSTRIVGEAIRSCAHPPNLWMNASTATIYRHSFDRPMDETTGEFGGHEPGAPETWRFSIDVASNWENAFFTSAAPRTRKIALRSAVVMNPDRGSAFDILLTLVRFGLGGASGSGKQFVSWIHDRDFVRSIEYLMAHQDLDGAINLASPNPLPNSDFMAALRKAWGARIGLPASEWMLAFGAIFIRTETELVLKSRRVVPGRMLAHGFNFDFPDWPAAARDLVARWRRPTSTAPATG
jgi:uncharacterized protein (TIGR01777 family)